MSARRWSVVVVTVLVVVVVVLVAFLAGGGDDERAQPASTTTTSVSASTTTTSVSDSTTTSPPSSQVPDTWVAGPDAPFWLGGLVVPAGEVVVAGAGGCCSMLPGPELAAYRAATRTWSLLPSSPTGCGPTAPVWTGQELVVLAGRTSPTCDGPEAVADPSAYALDPSAETWRRLASAPVTLSYGEAFWTGREVLVLGSEGTRPGRDVLLSYSPDRDTWRIGQAPPVPERFGSSVVWTGDVLLVWGGEVDAPGTAAGIMSLRDGAAYDPDRDTWTTVPAAPIPGAAGAVTAWTGEEMVVWGGQGTEGGGAISVPRDAGAAYDPDTQQWRMIATAPTSVRQVIAESEGFAGRGAWTGGELVVLLGQPGPGMDQPLAGGAYDPARDVWRVLPMDSGMSYAASVVWTGRSAAVIGGYRVGEERVEGVPPHVVELVPDARS